MQLLLKHVAGASELYCGYCCRCIKDSLAQILQTVTKIISCFLSVNSTYSDTCKCANFLPLAKVRDDEEPTNSRP